MDWRISTNLTNVASHAEVTSAVARHVGNTGAAALGGELEFEEIGLGQNAVQYGGVEGLADEPGADITTKTVGVVFGAVARTEVDLAEREQSAGDATAALPAGNGKGTLHRLREARSIGDVGSVAAEAEEGIEDGRFEHLGLAAGVEGPVPVGDTSCVTAVFAEIGLEHGQKLTMPRVEESVEVDGVRRPDVEGLIVVISGPHTRVDISGLAWHDLQAHDSRDVAQLFERG